MEKFCEHITSKEAERLIDEKESDPDFVVLDVRTPEEFRFGALKRAINLDIYDPAFAAEIGRLDKDKTYLVYCRSGNRSKAACSLMRNLGFGKIYELDRGILG